MLKVKEKGLVVYHRPNSIISEQFRTIRTNIQFCSMDQRIRTIAITAPGPGVGEGKSTTASNLAISVAQQGGKVLLVDADIRKPGIHTTFSLPNKIGLTDILQGKVAWREAIQQTPIERLEVLASGSVVPYPAELLNSERMEEWQKTAREEYDMVIFDCAPVLEVTDARIIAHQCDGVILVLGSGKTKTEKAIEAKRALEFAKAKVIGVILNQI